MSEENEFGYIEFSNDPIKLMRSRHVNAQTHKWKITGEANSRYSMVCEVCGILGEVTIIEHGSRERGIYTTAWVYYKDDNHFYCNVAGTTYWPKIPACSERVMKKALGG